MGSRRGLLRWTVAELYPYLERRDESRWALDDLLESSERVPVCRLLCSHRPPRERLARVRWPTVTRAPVFPIALALLFSIWADTRFWRLSRKRAPAPVRCGCGITRPVLFPSCRPEENSHGHHGFQSRNRPASPNLPAGANSRVTPVLAWNHSRAPARADRTCSPSW